MPLQLSDHIRTLLRDHDCVIIPDFGGLIADYAPAQIHPVRHTLAPPAKRVAFNQALTRNDGLLVAALSRTLHITPQEAQAQVEAAVQRLASELANDRRVELTGIGIFRRAGEQGIAFEYTGTDNLLAASYGLPELISRPVRATDALLARDRQVAVPQLAAGRARRGARAFKVAVVAATVGLVLSANYLIALRQGYLPAQLTIDSTWLSPARFTAAQNPVARQQAALANNSWGSQEVMIVKLPVRAAATSVPKVVAAPASAVKSVMPAVVPVASPAVAVAAKPTPAGPVSDQARPKATPTKPVPGWEGAKTPDSKEDLTKTIKGRTGRYYLIAAGYTSLKNAEKGRQALARLGYKARVIEPGPGSRLFRLSAADFTDRTSADRQAEVLRKRLESNLWVYNY